MDQLFLDQQLVSLPVAASMILSRLSGRHISAKSDAEALKVLNDVAHAISNVVAIWTRREDGTYRRLDAFELQEARFERGAMYLCRQSGDAVFNLWVKRGDMLLALKVLKAAGARFR